MKVKRVITISDEITSEMEKFPHRAIKIIKNHDCTIADAILNSKPYVEPICPYLSDQEVKQPCIDSPCERPRGDCISREALKEDLAKEIKTNDLGLWLKILSVIDNVPPVETFTLEDMQNNYDAGVDSVIGKYDKARGEWIEEHGLIACSNCHTIWLYRTTDFCPHCGADMRGGSKNE